MNEFPNSKIHTGSHLFWMLYKNINFDLYFHLRAIKLLLFIGCLVLARNIFVFWFLYHFIFAQQWLKHNTTFQKQPSLLTSMVALLENAIQIFKQFQKHISCKCDKEQNWENNVHYSYHVVFIHANFTVYQQNTSTNILSNKHENTLKYRGFRYCALIVHKIEHKVLPTFNRQHLYNICKNYLTGFSFKMLFFFSHHEPYLQSGIPFTFVSFVTCRRLEIPQKKKNTWR